MALGRRWWWFFGVIATVTALAACGANTLGPRLVAPSDPNGANRGGSITRRAPEERRVDVQIDSARLCVRVDRSVYCATGEPSQSLVTTTPLFARSTSFALGGSQFTCAVLAHAGAREGEVKCAGPNSYGELGAGLRALGSSTPVLVPGIADAISVAAGHHHACALSKDGTIRCWGKNESGQTGSSTSYEQDVRELVTPSVVPSIHTATKIVAANDATCALTKSREVMCWGMLRVPDDSGAHAYGSMKPFAIEGLVDVEDLAGGGETFCAALRNGEVHCWGELEKIVADTSSPLGVSSSSSLRSSSSPAAPHWLASLKPVHIEGIQNAVQVGVSRSTGHACALTRDGQVLCWGRNVHGELGRGRGIVEDASVQSSYMTVYENRLAPLPPEPVGQLPRAVAISVGYAMSCATTENEDVYCWGQWPYEYDEKDPNGDQKPIAFTPTRVPVR